MVWASACCSIINKRWRTSTRFRDCRTSYLWTLRVLVYSKIKMDVMYLLLWWNLLCVWWSSQSVKILLF